jgi:hypothetical protein
MPLDGVVFPRAGQYQFKVKVKGHTFGGPGLYLLELPGDSASA